MGGGAEREGRGPEPTDPYTTPPPEYAAPPGGPAYGGAPPPPPAPPRGRGGAVLVLGLLGLVLSVLLFPIGLALDVAAIVFGIRALRAASRARVATPELAVAGLVAGVVGAVLALLVTVAFALFYPQLRDYTDCMSGANTVTDQQECRREFERGVQRRFGVPVSLRMRP